MILMLWPTPALAALSLLAAFPLSAGPQKIDNRPPRPDEWGYRPADGSTSPLNPPSLTWIHEKDAATYTVQWAPDAAFESPQSASGFIWPTYTHHSPLKPGTYHWRYQFTTKDGANSNWSTTRSVLVPAKTAEFPMPTVAQQTERISKQHPRLFLRSEDLPRLRELATGRENERFANLRSEADKLLNQEPTPEPEHLGSSRDKNNLELIKYWYPNRQQTEKACTETETLAFVYMITKDKKYGEAARKRVVHLAGWDPDGPTNFHLNCEAGKPMLFRPARAYDWAWDMFTPEERKKIQAITKRRIEDAWKSGEVKEGTGHLNQPYVSHGNRVFHKIGETAVVFHDEIPEAKTWLDYAVNKFHACYPVWSDDDGGWHEGVGYWGGYLRKVVWWLQVSDSALQIDGLKKPFFSHVGDYPMYIAPPHSPNMGFGDNSYRTPSTSIGGFMDYFIRCKGAQPGGERASYWRWWTEQWGMKGETGILGFLYAANLPALPPAKPPTDLPPSKIFRGIGVASLHTTLLDSRDDVHFLFKSSPFGTRSHGHNPHNTFQLNAYGETLLPACVYRDLHGSPFHYKWVHSTLAHNGVLVNGEGQIKHSREPHGRIVASELTPKFDYIVGDAAKAYGKRLNRYLRHVAFVKGEQPFIVIYDELEANEPATFQFMLHGLKEFDINEKEHRLGLEMKKAGIAAQYLPPAPLKFRQWDGFDPPSRKKFPNHWHVEASTQEKRKQLGMFTVLVPHRARQFPQWNAERIDDHSIRVNLNGKSTTVRFPKPGKKLEIAIQ